MIADVPLGAFLSGGIDSSTVVALMQAQSTRPVKTFSIGFHDRGLRRGAVRQGRRGASAAPTTPSSTSSRSTRCDVIPRLADWFDEPFADSSQIPTYLVSELTRRHVTVALSGDGGDELFAGYNRYVWAGRLARAASAMPNGLHRPLAAAMRALSPDGWNRLLGWLPFLPRAALPGDKLHKMATLFDDPTPDAIYRRLVSQWDKPEDIAAAGHEPRGPLWDASVARDFPDFVARMQFLDLVTYLPDDILTKVDRATMAVGAGGEGAAARPPRRGLCLDPAARFKLRGGAGQVAAAPGARPLCAAPADRPPEMGFGVPIDSWLRGPLREWAEALLAPARLSADGFVRVEPVRRAWQEHLAGKRNWQHPLWTVLMLQAWRERWARPCGRADSMFVTTDLFIGGGAEAMLSRLATAHPPLADDITVVSLLRGSSHAEELRAKGVTVIELDFGGASGAPSGLWRVARLIAQIKPNIVQGWMYHGDLAALLALVLSGRRKRTRLIWSIRCSDMDFKRYGMRLRLVVRACVALSSKPDSSPPIRWRG